MKIGVSIQVILRFRLRNLRGCNICILLMGDIIMYVVETAQYGVIYLPSFIKIDAGIQAIWRFFLSNLNGSNAGTAEGNNLLITPLRWVYVPWHTYKVS
jgi:hypothetical protein